jgi:DegV family protein with EDD domain
MTVAGNLATLVLLAKEWASQGISAEAIVSRIKEWIPRGHIFFLVDTLEYLQKGGRIGGAKALLGEMLQIKPILCVKDGQVEPFEQQRTKRRALARIMEVVDEKCPKGPSSHLCVMHSEALQEARVIAADLKAKMGITDVPIYEMPPAIVTHGGPGILAIGFFEA